MPRSRDGSHDARILMLSTRGLRLHASRGAIYEFEDVIRQCEDVDLIAPEGRSTVFKLSNRIANKAVRAIRSVPSYAGRPIKVDGHYDLFVFFCQSAQDILLLNSLKGWRDRSRYAVCWLDELWSQDIEAMRPQLSLLAGFDRIVMNFESSRAKVAEITGVPVVAMPFGVDAKRFNPGTAERSIDVLNVGRRSEVTHAALEGAMNSDDFFYYYDTLASLQMSARGGHRNLYANLAKRSRYSIVNKAKFNLGGGMNPHDEVGPRFYEGMASGTVMLGVPPRCTTFTENFDWPDSVIEIPFDCPDIVDVIADLDRQPDRLDAVRRENVSHALLNHDWIYRWDTVLDSVDLRSTARAEARRQHLIELDQILAHSEAASTMPQQRQVSGTVPAGTAPPAMSLPTGRRPG